MSHTDHPINLFLLKRCERLVLQAPHGHASLEDAEPGRFLVTPLGRWRPQHRCVTGSASLQHVSSVLYTWGIVFQKPVVAVVLRVALLLCPVGPRWGLRKADWSGLAAHSCNSRASGAGEEDLGFQGHLTTQGYTRLFQEKKRVKMCCIYVDCVRFFMLTWVFICGKFTFCFIFVYFGRKNVCLGMKCSLFLYTNKKVGVGLVSVIW